MTLRDALRRSARRPAIRPFISAIKLATAALALLIACAAAHAQGGVPLITVATNQTPLSLSTQFGIPAGAAVNQNGDFAFIGSGATALFFRAAGASSITRLLQVGDAVPGISGSLILSFSSAIAINSSKTILFEVMYSPGAPLGNAAILTYDQTSYHLIATSSDTAPGSGGLTYGPNLSMGGIDDNGDISFVAILSSNLQDPAGYTFYIAPGGAAPVRVAGQGDTPPEACTWCIAGGGNSNFLSQTVAPFPPPIDDLGQIPIYIDGGLFLGTKNGIALVPMASSGICSPGQSTVASTANSAYLNNNGAVAFLAASNSGAAVCLAPAGGGQPFVVSAPAMAAPGSLGGAIGASTVLWGLNDSGDVVYTVSISGNTSTTFALLHYVESTGQANVVAYDQEPAPGVSGESLVLNPQPDEDISFSSTTLSGAGNDVSPISIGNDGHVSFNVFLLPTGNAVYEQTGTSAPVLLTSNAQGQSQTTFNASFPGATLALNNGATFFSAFLPDVSGNFGEFLGTPGNLQALVSTADALPQGAKTILPEAAPAAGGHFVAFIAQALGGRNSLLVSDLSSGTIARVASDGDPALVSAGAPGLAEILPGALMNANGQVAFVVGSQVPSGAFNLPFYLDPLGSTAGASPYPCGAIFLWSPGGGLSKVVAPGDTPPMGGNPFTCASVTSLNNSGQVVFEGSFPVTIGCGVGENCVGINTNDGAFLFTPGAGVSEIAADGDTLPGQTAPTMLIAPGPVNSSGQTVFGAQVGGSYSFDPMLPELFLENPSAPPVKITATGDAVPGTADQFDAFHFISGLSDQGNVAFTAADTSAADGLFYAPASGSIQAIALDGGPAPAGIGGTFSLVSSGSLLIPPANFAAINSESNIAFSAAIDTGAVGSAIFRLLQVGPSAGVLQPVVLQGQSVTDNGALGAIPGASSSGPNFSLGPDGQLAFVNLYSVGPQLNQGLFVVRQDGSLIKAISTQDTLPGGGTPANLIAASGAVPADPGKFAFWTTIQGGTAGQAIFSTAISAGLVATATAPGSSLDPVIFGQPITLSATVTSAGAGTPTGSVSFFGDGIFLGTAALNSTSQASVNVASLPSGSEAIVAQYSGDANFSSSNSAPLTETVNPRATSTTLTASAGPIIGGQPVTFTARVATSAGGAPTGSVAFLDNGSMIGSAALNASAVAVFNTSALSIAAHSITAQYAGDTNSTASTSSALTETVNAAGFAPPSSSLTVARGQTLTVPLTFYAAPGSTATFTFSCSGLPAQSSCSFNPSSAAPPPSGTAIQMMFSTTAASRFPFVPPRHAPWPISSPFVVAQFIALATLFALALVGLRLMPGLRPQSPTQTSRLALAICSLVMGTALVLAGCGSSGSSGSTSNAAAAGTPSGAAAITVTASSSSATVSTVVNVTIQ